MWRTVKNQYEVLKEYITTTKVKKDAWINYFTELYDYVAEPDYIKINV